MASMELAGGGSPREEFAALVTEHSRSMFRAARSLLDCDADAEDAVSEAILRAWLLKITVNCACEQRRRCSPTASGPGSVPRRRTCRSPIRT